MQKYCKILLLIIFLTLLCGCEQQNAMIKILNNQYNGDFEITQKLADGTFAAHNNTDNTAFIIYGLNKKSNTVSENYLTRKKSNELTAEFHKNLNEKDDVFIYCSISPIILTSDSIDYENIYCLICSPEELSIEDLQQMVGDMNISGHITVDKTYGDDTYYITEYMKEYCVTYDDFPAVVKKEIFYNIKKRRDNSRPYKLRNR